MGGDTSKPVHGSTASPTYRRFRNATSSPSVDSSKFPNIVATERSSTRLQNGTMADCQQAPPERSTDASSITEEYRGNSSADLTNSLNSSSSTYIIPTSATTSVDTKGDSTTDSRGGSLLTASPPSRKLGLWNVGNTCYINSVLQVLYENQVFRECSEGEIGVADGDGLLNALAQLFIQINGAKKAKRIKPCVVAHINPTKFVQRLKEKNTIFRSPDHHDAHEFYSYLMNAIGEELLQRREHSVTNTASSPQSNRPISPPTEASGPSSRWSSRGSSGDIAGSQATPSPHRPTSRLLPESPSTPQPTTWLHELFQGYIVYETRCLCCENVTRRREPFLDVPLDVELADVNLPTCIRSFAGTELLKGKDKYFCDLCGCLQEAERSLRFERLPRILVIHLKRFKYDEARGCYSRVSSKVEFPSSLSFPPDALARSHPFILSSTDSSFSENPQSANVAMITSREAPLIQMGSQDIQKPEHTTTPMSFRVGDGIMNRERLTRTSKQTQMGPEFDLFGVVVHIGTSMTHGHYISCVKSDDGSWWLYDDHNVKPISPNALSLFYGSSDRSTGAKCGTPFPFKRRTRLLGSRWFQNLSFTKRTDEGVNVTGFNPAGPDSNISTVEQNHYSEI